MATDQKFMDFVLEQMSERSGDLAVTSKKMFGEYGVFSEGKMFALVCDNKLFFKPTESGRAFVGEIAEGSPYPGAKPCFLIEEQIEDREWLSELIKLTVKELPLPKKRKKKKKA